MHLRSKIRITSYNVCYTKLLRSFDNEVANGVMITKNLYNENHAFTINVQFGEASVVKPPHGIIPDQVLVYTASFAVITSYSIHYTKLYECQNAHVETFLKR